MQGPLRILLCLGALTGLGSGLPGLSGFVNEGPAVQVPALPVQTKVEVLKSDYGLEMLRVPEVPVDLQKEPVAPRPAIKTRTKTNKEVKACPLEVRAIVEAETMDDSFAMLSVDGDTRLVHLKQVIDTLSGSFVLGAIQSSGVVLHKGNQKISCSLGR